MRHDQINLPRKRNRFLDSSRLFRLYGSGSTGMKDNQLIQGAHQFNKLISDINRFLAKYPDRKIEVNYQPSEIKARYGYNHFGKVTRYGKQFLTGEDFDNVG